MQLLKALLAWLPNLDRRVWILSAGRLLSQIGNGFVLFYAPIFFVNQVGLSATAVGIGIGSGSVSGIVGRVLGGSMCDSPQWGRRNTLLWSAAISALADVGLVFAQDFPVFLMSNILMGFGIGLYWPATEAVVADIIDPEQGNEAFALVRLADSVGLSSGVILGGALITLTGLYRLLFVIDGISFLFFFGIIFLAIAETATPQSDSHTFFSGWGTALRDRPLLIYCLVNIGFTTYLAQLQSTMPVYFSRFATSGGSETGFSEATLSVLFTWHVVLTAICQLPIARRLNRLRHCQALIGSALFWGLGFIFIWLTGVATWGALLWAFLALGIMAIATVMYLPSASMVVVTLSPQSLRGVYMSINSLCWAVGYFIGPTLGGWALDQERWMIDSFWITSALSVALVIGILWALDQIIQNRQRGVGDG